MPLNSVVYGACGYENIFYTYRDTPTSGRDTGPRTKIMVQEEQKEDGMEARKSWQQSTGWLAIFAGVLSLLLVIPDADAKRSKRAQRSKGVPSSVAKSPTCDSYAHPKIITVTPDPVKPGQKITIKGKNFGTKACFKGVSFGRYSIKRFQYVNDTTLVAMVPNLKPGITPVSILTAGGSSEYIVLIEKGKVKKSRKVKKSKRSKRSRRSTRR